jgi:spermidine synthase
MIANSLPYWPIDPYISGSPWYNFQLDILRCIWVILPAACLWGASFPLALASVISPGKDSGKIVGGIYAVNTIGAIIGSICFTLFVIPRFGTQQAQRVLIVLAAVAAFIMLKSLLFSREKRELSSRGNGIYILRFAVIILFAGVLVGIGFLVKSVDKIPWGLISNGRYMATLSYQMVPGITKEEDIPTDSASQDVYCTYAAEGMNVSIAVTKTSSGLQCFHGAGKVQASNDPQDMRLQRMLGHISALINKNPESVLVVACGAGVTAGSFVPHPEVKRIVICDIEPLVPHNVAPRFAKENFDVVNDPRTELVFDDGRHFIHTTKEKFDVITSDPIDPWVKGCAALNTVEYYTMCKEHLNPGGVMALWMPFYESNSQTVKSLISTFFEVFPNGIIWSNDFSGVGYDAVLFGQVGPTQINLDELQERLNREDHFTVKQSLNEVGFYSIIDLLATYGGQATDLHGWREGAQINTDRNLRLQYLAGMWLNAYQEDKNFAEILSYYRFPDDLFIGSEANLSALKSALENSGRRENSNLLSVNN